MAILAPLVPIIIALLLAYDLTPDAFYRLFIFSQDVPLLPLFLIAFLLRPRKAARPSQLGQRRSVLLTPAVVAAAIVVIGWAGHYLVFSGFDLSRDEKLANFDAAIFAHGKLFWEIPKDWRAIADALNLTFMLPVGAREFWVSAYLPTHAMLRALVGKVVDPALTSPLLAAMAAFLLWRIASRLWPQSRSTQVVALLLFVGSSQVLVTAMTAFSMTMHLALNLLWLALFLADRRSTHVLAVLVGLVATGIHQPLFHPLFVAPFLLLLVQQKRWKLLGFYVAAYALIAAVWLAWPVWISSHGTAPAVPIESTSAIGFFDRLFAIVSHPAQESIVLSLANWLRFIVWQHPLLLPLSIFGAITCWRTEPVARALALGFILPLVVVAVLLPWQGHGWGYRYLHPVLGNAILLACYGWHRLEQRGFDFDRPMVAMTAVSVALLLPVHSWMARQMVAPFVAVSSQLSRSGADLVIVDTDAAIFGADFVYNPPDLSARPILLMGSKLRPEQVARLCEGRTIAFLEGTGLKPVTDFFSVKAPSEPTIGFRRLEEAARDRGCAVR